MGAFITLPFQLIQRACGKGLLGLLIKRIVFQNQAAHGFHIAGGGAVEATAEAEAVAGDFKVEAGDGGPMHFPTAEDKPHIVPIEGFVMGEAGVSADTADGFIHSGLRGEERVNGEGRGRQVLYKVPERLENQALVIRLVLLEPGPAVAQTVLEQEIQGFLRKKYHIRPPGPPPVAGREKGCPLPPSQVRRCFLAAVFVLL